MSVMRLWLVLIADLSLEEEHLFGNLIITIYRLQGLKQPAGKRILSEL